MSVFDLTPEVFHIFESGTARFIFLNQVQLDGRGPGVDQLSLQGREDGKEDESPVQV